MERFIKNDVVVIPFPFTDLTGSTRRPALVIVDLKGDDLILCQITTQKKFDEYSIPLNDNDLKEGSLRRENNNIRPNRIFTADKQIILYRIGHLKEEKMKEVIEKIIQMIQS